MLHSSSRASLPAGGRGRSVLFCCSPDNDLFALLARLGAPQARYDHLEDAVAAAPEGAGVLALADDYPRLSPGLSESTAQRVAAKGLRLYVEYPASAPGIVLGPPQPTQWERLVVSSGFFEPELARGAILAQHGCWFLRLGVSAAAQEGHALWAPEGGDCDAPMTGPRAVGDEAEVAGRAPDVLQTGTLPLLAIARVAGYDRAVYGLPPDAQPVLLALPGCPVLLAGTSLSRFVRARYGPQLAWRVIWERLLTWLDPGAELPALVWTPTVRVQAGPEAPFTAQDERRAFDRALGWFREQVVYSIDWKKGAIEGFESAIDHEGRQKRRPWSRGDCTAETGMVLAHHWSLTKDPDSRLLATQILDYVWSAPDYLQGDPGSPAYGLSNWYERGPVFYGDDNARVVIPTLVSGQLLADDRWDVHALRCLLANLRTTGRLGFRRNRIDLRDLVEQERGWALFYDEETLSYAPHYQAYLWAAYLLAYALTGFGGFRDRTLTAIRMTMDIYPRWRWTNGLTQEMARMLLPLAFLVRIEDTVEHRGWLAQVSTDLLAHMQPCGAIREALGPAESGRYGPPASNGAYGTTEAPLIQANGDPACDLLYTANYALVGLHEAAAATGERRLHEAEGRLARFLGRIQVRSESHPYLDGAWMRSFDYERWEYWGSSADAGWGAWCVESGWTNTWIASVLAMRQRGQNLFDLATGRALRVDVGALVSEMLPAVGGALPAS
ncbi:MAG: hypothetical protein JXA09_11720 [Anaerolineae bacterium]|nr:hypothetical protein [Anaerolineae bacterium]